MSTTTRRRAGVDRHLGRDLAGQLAELSLQRTNTRLTRVAGDGRAQRGLRQRDLVGAQPGQLDLARQQVALGDEDLLVLGVAVEADELHAVEQRRRDGVGDVGRGDEDDVAEVEVDLEVVVAERVVLCRVEHLEQRSRRVATPSAGAQLVDLVEQHDRVHRTGFDHRPGDAARLAADVGATVTADLGLVAHATQRHAHELATHRPGDGLAEAGLADTGRPDEGQHGTRLPWPWPSVGWMSRATRSLRTARNSTMRSFTSSRP